MAILVILKSNQAGSYGFTGDIVGIFEDDHPFSPAELASSEFLTIQGSAEAVSQRLQELDVDYAEAYWNPSTEVWQFTDPLLDETPPKTVWTPGGNPLRWYELVAPFKYRWSIGDLTEQEKEQLSTIDIFHPAVESAVKRVMKDLIATNPDNGTEIVDLRNLVP